MDDPAPATTAERRRRSRPPATTGPGRRLGDQDDTDLVALDSDADPDGDVVEANGSARQAADETGRAGEVEGSRPVRMGCRGSGRG